MHFQETDYICNLCLKKSSYSFVNSKSLKQRISNQTKNEKDIRKLNFCVNCGVSLSDEIECEKEKFLNQKNGYTESKHSQTLWVVLIILGIIFLIIYYRSPTPKQTIVDLKSEVEKLMKKYPNQYPQLWQNVWKITNASKPLVHSLILLYEEDGYIAECFAKDLIKLLNKMNNKNEVVTFKENIEVTDYGEELIYYMELIRKSNHLFIPQLHNIPGNLARMFHFLCDDTPTTIKPAYFIFTVKDGNNKIHEAKHLSSKAAQILRSAWSNLKDNELHPLISRVLRNVAVVLPEKITC